MVKMFAVILSTFVSFNSLRGVSQISSAKIEKEKTLSINIASLNLMYRQRDFDGIVILGDTFSIQEKEVASDLSLGFSYSINKNFAFSFTINFKEDWEKITTKENGITSDEKSYMSVGFGDFLITGKFSRAVSEPLYVGLSPFVGIPLGEKDTFRILKDANSSPIEYTGGFFRKFSSNNIYGGINLLFSFIPDERVGIHLNTGYTSSRYGEASDYITYGAGAEIIPGNVQPYLAFYGRYYLHDEEIDTTYKYGKGFNCLEGGLRFTSESGVSFTIGAWTPITTLSPSSMVTDIPDWSPDFGIYLALGYVQPEKKEKAPVLERKTGEIAGRIFDKRTGKSLFAKVSVKVDTQYVETVSDSITGEYRLKNIPEGIYVITVTCPGYQEHGATVAVREGQTTVRDFALVKVAPKRIPKGTLTGKVTDRSTGKPLYAKITFVGSDIEPVYTDSVTGIYKVDLPEGTYAVKVEAQGYIPQARPVIIERLETRIENFALLKKGMRLVFRNIYFEPGKATIKPESFSILDSIAQMLKDNPNIIVEIQGHTDNIGSEEFNLELSQRRAEAVKDYLVHVHGIDPQRLIARGYGEYRPIAPNDTPEGRAQNRRVEFVILGTLEENQ